MIKIKPKFEDCKECIHFRINKIRKICIECSKGEFFEYKVSDFDNENNRDLDYEIKNGFCEDE